jgi:hypothetical protein
VKCDAEHQRLKVEAYFLRRHNSAQINRGEPVPQERNERSDNDRRLDICSVSQVWQNNSHPLSGGLDEQFEDILDFESCKSLVGEIAFKGNFS